jgi:hypothetical protein
MVYGGISSPKPLMAINRNHLIGLGIGLSTAAVSIALGAYQAHNAKCKAYETELLENRVAFLRTAAESRELLGLASALGTEEFLPRVYELQARLKSLSARTGDVMPVYREICGEERFESWKREHKNQLGL